MAFETHHHVIEKDGLECLSTTADYYLVEKMLALRKLTYIAVRKVAFSPSRKYVLVSSTSM